MEIGGERSDVVVDLRLSRRTLSPGQGRLSLELLHLGLRPDDDRDEVDLAFDGDDFEEVVLLNPLDTGMMTSVIIDR